MSAGMRIALLMVILLAGCGRLEPVPSDTFYRLAPYQGAGAASGGHWSDSALLVKRFRARGVYKDRAIVLADSNGVSVSQQRYHYWHESPELMLQQRFAEHLRAARVAKAVVTHNDFASNMSITGEVHRFERIRLESGAGVAVELEMTISNVNSEPRVLYQERLIYEQPAAGSTESDGVQAISSAVDKLFVQFINNASHVIELQHK